MDVPGAAVRLASHTILCKAASGQPQACRAAREAATHSSADVSTAGVLRAQRSAGEDGGETTQL
jgi:hypothetical protein